MKIKLNLKGGFKTVQEGERVLEITSAKVSPSGKPNKLTLQMKDVEDGASLQNSYNLDNSTSVWAMGMLLSTALDLSDGDEFDLSEADRLVGIKLLCEVAHSEYNEKTYANVKKVLSRVEDNNTATEETVEYPDMSTISRSALSEDDLD